MDIKIVKQSDLTSECWSVQVWGLQYCEKCEFKDTDECGGKRIREFAQNENGRLVPLGREV
jgi:hypothetical protein